MIIHIETSIKENSKRKMQETINALGKQLTKEKLEGIKKDRTIAELGRQESRLSLEVMRMKNEINALKQSYEKDKKGGE